MSKASTSSLPLRYLLRQLYLAKAVPASSSSALEAGLLGASSSSNKSHGHARRHGRSRSNHGAHSSTATASFGTSARSTNGIAPLDVPNAHASAAIPAGLSASSSSSNAPHSRSHGTATASSSNNGIPTSSSHHHHRYPRHGSASSSHVVATPSLLPSFWVQPPSSSSGTPPPPVQSFPPPPPHASATSSASTSSTAASSSSSHQHGESAHPARFTQRIDDQQRENQIHHSSLTLHPGAYGIPKRLSASAKGKDREVDPADPVQAQISQMQQTLLSVQVGEDAYFVRNDALGVADGVGGWSGRKGADPGLFAARLMHHCSAELALCEDLGQGISPHAHTTSNGSTDSSAKLSFTSASAANSNQRSASTLANGSERGSEASPTSNGQTEASSSSSSPSSSSVSDSNSQSRAHKVPDADPIEIMHRAWDQTLTEFFDFELIGSSTALIAVLKDDELRVANIGDCCCGIIRGQDYIFRSQEQQHSFNYPFQMGTNSKDTPRKDGQRFNIKVQKDDIVILSSDGLVDNLFDEDILEEVLRHGDSPERISKALCSRAKAVCEDQRAVTSPFQQRANEEGIHFVGGKHDDISVLVAIIGDKNEDTLSA